MRQNPAFLYLKPSVEIWGYTQVLPVLGDKQQQVETPVFPAPSPVYTMWDEVELSCARAYWGYKLSPLTPAWSTGPPDDVSHFQSSPVSFKNVQSYTLSIS